MTSNPNFYETYKRAISRAASAQDELLKWLGDNGRFLVSSRITEKTFDHLEAQEVKGRIPSPYNEEFVRDILEMKKCICGTELNEGSTEYEKIESLLQKSANKMLRSRLSSVRSTLNELKREREKAPGRLDVANKRLAEARQDISAIEAELGEISDKLSGIDFDEIAQRERRRNELRDEHNGIDEAFQHLVDGQYLRKRNTLCPATNLRVLCTLGLPPLCFFRLPRQQGCMPVPVVFIEHVQVESVAGARAACRCVRRVPLHNRKLCLRPWHHS